MERCLHHFSFNACDKSNEVFRKGNGVTVIKIFVDYVLNLLNTVPLNESLTRHENGCYTYLTLLKNNGSITVHTNPDKCDVHVDLSTTAIINPDVVVCYSKHYFKPFFTANRLLIDLWASAAPPGVRTF